MANIQVQKNPPVTTIDKFLGINEDTSSDTQIKFGESPNMTNFRLTENYKLTKREGYKQLFSQYSTNKTIQGMFSGTINSVTYFLFAMDSKIWVQEEISGVDYNSLDTSYSNVDVIKTTPLTISPIQAGTTGVDGFNIYSNSNGVTLTEVSQANINLTASIGKYYYHTDKSIWIIVAKGSYASITEARNGLGTTYVYQQLYNPSITLSDSITNFFTFDDTTYTFGNVVSYLRNTYLYIMDGTGYYYWNGTTYASVEGYVPQVSISSLYDGTEATEYEPLNLLTNKRYQSLTGASDYSISDLQYDTLDKTTFTNIHVVKTLPIASIVPGTASVDAIVVVKNNAGTILTEVSYANIDLTASIGKYYIHTDKSIWFIVSKTAYAAISNAREGLGTSYWCPLVYQLAEKNIKSVDYVYLYSSTINIFQLRTVTTDYVVDLQNGRIRFISQPIASPNTIQVYYAKGFQTDLSTVNGTTTYNVNYNGVNITNLDSVDFVYLNGTLKTLTTDYTVNLVNGTITLTSNPGNGNVNLVIFASKNSLFKSEITDRKYNIRFGGSNDFRIFLYGKQTGQGTNRYYYSNLANGLPSASYFPATFYNDVGTPENKITAITRQYDRQIIYTDINGAYYSYYQTTTIDGVVVPSFPLYTLNKVIGNVALGQVQIVQNNPVSIFKGLQEWIGTSVEDERNAKYISKRIQPSLDSIDLKSVTTIDWEKNYEYWLCYQNKAYIYNYRLDTFYIFQFAHNIKPLLIKDDTLYFGTDNGQVMKFDSSYTTDNGTAIKSHWETGFYDFNAEWLQKYLYEAWISLKAQTTSLSLYYKTELGDSPIQTISLNVGQQFTFASLNFSSLSFSYLGSSAKIIRFKLKAKKFVFFKLVLDNNNAEDLTVLAINLAPSYGSKTKSII